MFAVYKTFGQETIEDDRFYTFINIANMGSSALCRLGCAALMDRFGFRKVFLCILLTQLVLGYTYYLTRASKALFLLATSLEMGLEGGIISTLLGLCGRIFGHQMGVKVYSGLYFSLIIGLLLSVLLQSLLLAQVGFVCMFLVIASLNWGSLALLRALPVESPWKAGSKPILIEFKNDFSP